MAPLLTSKKLTYVSADFSDQEPFSPSYLLYGRKIHPIPHPIDNPDNLDYLDANNIRKEETKKHTPGPTAWYRLAIVEKHIKEKDNMVHTAYIRMGIYAYDNSSYCQVVAIG